MTHPVKRVLAVLRGSAALVLLAAAVAFGAIAWQLQESATADLKRAREVQQDEIGDDSSDPPKVSEYRQILETLDRSIRIRRNIDASLGRIEKAVAGLQGEQQKAAAVAEASSGEITKIATKLGSAAGSARSVARALNTLDDRLDTSGRLSRLIAEELEELDRRFGPTLGQDLIDRIKDILPERP